MSDGVVVFILSGDRKIEEGLNEQNGGMISISVRITLREGVSVDV